jgi:hypothetical protein
MLLGGCAITVKGDQSVLLNGLPVYAQAGQTATDAKSTTETEKSWSEENWGWVALGTVVVVGIMIGIIAATNGSSGSHDSQTTKPGGFGK